MRTIVSLLKGAGRSAGAGATVWPDVRRAGARRRLPERGRCERTRTRRTRVRISVPGTPGIGARAGGSGLAFSPNGKLLAQGTEILSVSATTAPSPVGGPPPDPCQR